MTLIWIDLIYNSITLTSNHIIHLMILKFIGIFIYLFYIIKVF